GQRLGHLIGGGGQPGGRIVDAVTEALAAAPPGEGLPARRLTATVPRLATKLVMGAGTNHEVSAGATSRVLGVLANEGLVVRGRPAGSWTGRTYHWHLRHDWLGPPAAHDRQPETAPPHPPSPERVQAASTELVERWLRAFGPAPVSDIKWWTGWTVRQVKAALAGLDVVEVALDGDETGVVLADDVDGDDDDPGPWVALLPSLDPTPMGWKERHWYLGPHQGPLFDRNGNIGPTVWVDGRIVGGWSQTSDGRVVTSLLEDVGADHRAMIELEAARLTELVAPTVVKPSFPTPLQKELSASA
ncbi:MAG: winged helix DNA-binding domain-containing protein, partial [Actinomycetota bacterium]